MDLVDKGACPQGFRVMLNPFYPRGLHDVGSKLTRISLRCEVKVTLLGTLEALATVDYKSTIVEALSSDLQILRQEAVQNSTNQNSLSFYDKAAIGYRHSKGDENQ